MRSGVERENRAAGPGESRLSRHRLRERQGPGDSAGPGGVTRGGVPEASAAGGEAGI